MTIPCSCFLILYSCFYFFFFFFSSRRRHTRFDCDWSTDVCSSDLDRRHRRAEPVAVPDDGQDRDAGLPGAAQPRSEEHTSELQSQSNLVCRLLLEKKKKKTNNNKSKKQKANNETTNTFDTTIHNSL